MVYIGNEKIMNTDDIIQHLTNVDDILRVIKSCYKASEFKHDDIDVEIKSKNVLFNVVDDLKGHQNIIDLENQIIKICNNTIKSYGLNIKKIESVKE